jgi:thiol-disulfide isomerase/thioredoxin
MIRTTVLLACAASLAAQDPVIVQGAVKVAEAGNREAMPPVLPASESVALAATAPAGVTVPAGLADAMAGAAKLGGKSVAVVIGKKAADAKSFDTLCIDANADGKWGDDEHHAIEVTAMQGRNNAPAGERSKPVDCTIALGAGKLAAKASYMRMGENPPTVALQFPAYLEAKVKVGDVERIVAIVDKDLDGSFAGKDDLWVLAKAGDRPALPFALSQLGEKRFVDGQLVGIKVEAGNTVKVTAAAAKGPDAKDAAAHRERVEHQWFERFDKEKADFVAQRKLDTTRPRAKAPIAWNYVTFDEAIELGKKAGKPVFVDVMAFWCVWCYRMDYYTYVDQEVADVLGTQFVPCKVIQEQDLAGDYDVLMKQKLEAKGIPAMGIFGADGNALHKIGGWKAPVDFLADLKQGAEAFAAAKGK